MGKQFAEFERAGPYFAGSKSAKNKTGPQKNVHTTVTSQERTSPIRRESVYQDWRFCQATRTAYADKAAWTFRGKGVRCRRAASTEDTIVRTVDVVRQEAQAGRVSIKTSSQGPLRGKGKFPQCQGWPRPAQRAGSMSSPWMVACWISINLGHLESPAISQFRWREIFLLLGHGRNHAGAI